jgi:hypothetical protein
MQPGDDPEGPPPQRLVAPLAPLLHGLVPEGRHIDRL